MTKRQAKQVQQTTLNKLSASPGKWWTRNTVLRLFTFNSCSWWPSTWHQCLWVFTANSPSCDQKMSGLVASGITDTAEVKHHIQFYIRNTIPSELGIEAKASNRSFHPTIVDVRNHFWITKKALELSKIDQESVRCKFEHWKKSCPESSFYFRSYIKHDKASPKPTRDEQCTFPSLGKPAHYNGAEDDSTNIAGSDGNCSQTLLLVHQEHLLDTTYKTTKYDLALFFLRAH